MLQLKKKLTLRQINSRIHPNHFKYPELNKNQSKIFSFLKTYPEVTHINNMYSMK